MSDVYDYKYDCEDDPYTYPGTQILKNKFNIRASISIETEHCS